VASIYGVKTWKEPSALQLAELQHARRFDLDNESLRAEAEAEARRVGGSPAPARRHLSSNQIGTQEGKTPAIRTKSIKSATMKFAQGGRFVKVHVPRGEDERQRPGQRQKIRGFSRASRRQLMKELNSIDRTQVEADRCAMATMTYPGRFPSPAGAKKDLKCIRERIRRTWGKLPFYWKLEPQDRGAPHFHFLMFFESVDQLRAFAQWLPGAWHEIAGQDDPNHLKWHRGQLGNKHCVEPMRSWNGVIDYGSKYVGKMIDASQFTAWEFPGRWWGKQCFEALPIEIVGEDVDEFEVKIARRTVRRFLEHQQTGRWRIEDPDNGKVKRTWGKSHRFNELRKFGMIIRPYHRRHRSSRGGISCFMSDTDAARILAFAKDEVHQRRRRESFERWCPI
jgi:hypothetical protein